MSFSSTQSDPGGSFSPENAPQVVVRAGKTFVCSACGTMVEIPPEFVGQLVLVAEQSPADKPVGQSPDGETTSHATSAKEVASSDVSTQAAESFAVPGHLETRNPPVQVEDRLLKPKKHRPPRPKRPTPPKPSFVGQMIDGLMVPSAEKMDRALAWVSFHLKVLERQGSEVKRLQKLLKQRSSQPVPPARPRGNAQTASAHNLPGQSKHAERSHAHADVNMAPDLESTRERGPP